tara:strand:+ start:183 stop:431 length:249 start_codon:yes stop_codon:yes gene_type:complete
MTPIDEARTQGISVDYHHALNVISAAAILDLAGTLIRGHQTHFFKSRDDLANAAGWLISTLNEPECTVARDYLAKTVKAFRS